MPKDQQKISYKTQIEGALPSSINNVSLAITAGCLVALCFGSDAVLNWANNLPINDASNEFDNIAQAWQSLMSNVHLNIVSHYLKNMTS
jgi:hypothetical protein